jgi:hypothetical protein
VQNTADAIVSKTQIAVKLGKVEGYAKALGMESVKFLQINPNISIHEFGIFIDDAQQDFERQQLLQELNLRDSQGLIEPEDKILVMSCRNLKMASMILSYRIKKRKEKAQEYELQKIQANNQGNIQATQVAQDEQRKTLAVQLEADISRINAEKQWDYIIAMGKKEKDVEEANIQSQAKIIAQQISADSKIQIHNQKMSKNES